VHDGRALEKGRMNAGGHGIPKAEVAAENKDPM
jgi:hypothetical protein